MNVIFSAAAFINNTTIGDVPINVEKGGAALLALSG